MKAYGYTRWSPRPDADETQSSVKQADHITEYCQAKGYDLAVILDEPDTSGGFDDNDPDPMAFYRSRPQLFEILGLVKAGDVLVCRWRDRIARSVHAQGIVRMELAQKLAHWEATDEPNDESPEGRFMQQLYAGMAELKRWQIKIATARAMQKHQAKGRRMGRIDRVPFGFRADLTSAPNSRGNPGLIVPDAEEQETLQLIHQAAGRGLTPRAICRHLDGLGRSRRGKCWVGAASVVVGILRRNGRH